MEVKSSLKFTRVNTQKTRIVANLIRGKHVEKALRQLAFSDRKPAKTIKKLLLSTIANARQSNYIDIDNLIIKKITIDKGPYYKRQIPRAQGRSSLIKKKLSHIHLVLSER